MATPDDLRAYQVHMTDTGVTPPTFSAQIMALRFPLDTICGLALSRKAEARSDFVSAAKSGVQFSQASGRHIKARHVAHFVAQFCYPSVGGEHRCASDPDSSRPCQAQHDGPLYVCRHQTIRGGGHLAKSVLGIAAFIRAQSPPVLDERESCSAPCRG